MFPTHLVALFRSAVQLEWPKALSHPSLEMERQLVYATLYQWLVKIYVIQLARNRRNFES